MTYPSFGRPAPPNLDDMQPPAPAPATAPLPIGELYADLVLVPRIDTAALQRACELVTVAVEQAVRDGLRAANQGSKPA